MLVCRLRGNASSVGHRSHLRIRTPQKMLVRLLVGYPSAPLSTRVAGQLDYSAVETAVKRILEKDWEYILKKSLRSFLKFARGVSAFQQVSGGCLLREK